MSKSKRVDSDEQTQRTLLTTTELKLGNIRHKETLYETTRLALFRDLLTNTKQNKKALQFIKAQVLK